MATRTKRFTVDANFNVADLDKFFAFIQRSGGTILDQFPVQLQSGTTHYYVIYDDAVPPFVLRTFPADGQVNVPAGSTIVIVFNEDIILGSDPISIDKDGSPVVGFSVSETSGRIEITGAIDTVPGSYLVTIDSTKVTDAAGNQMEADFAFTFTTTSDIFDGDSIIAEINTSSPSSIIDSDNVEPDRCINRNIHSIYDKSVGLRTRELAATGVYSDDFFDDISADPGGSYTPSTTTTEVDTDRMKLRNPDTSPSDTAVYYSEFVAAVGATGVLLEADIDLLTGGSVSYDLIKDAEVGGFTSLTPGVFETIGALSTGFRLKATLTNPGTGGTNEVINHELHWYT